MAKLGKRHLVMPKEGGFLREENRGLRTPNWFPPYKKSLRLALEECKL